MQPVVSRIDARLEVMLASLSANQKIDLIIQCDVSFDPKTVPELEVSSTGLVGSRQGATVITGCGSDVTVDFLRTAPGVIKVSTSHVMKMHHGE